MPHPPHTLPEWALRLLEHLVPEANRDVVVGDFAEVFHYVALEEGPMSAIRWYFWQLLRSLPSFFLNGVSMGGSMLGNYTKVAVRNLAKRKFYTALNIGGLAIGMAVCLLILQYVVFETSYDDFHDDADRIFRLNMETFQGTESLGKDANTYWAMADLFAESVPGAVAVTRIHPIYGSGVIQPVDSVGESVTYRERAIGFVEPSYFEVFNFPGVEGDPVEGLRRRGTVVLSRRMAKKFFGDDNPIGRTLRARAWIDREYEVAAVIDDPRPNSHLGFEILLPYEDLVHGGSGQYAETDGWSWSNFVTYARLSPGASVESTERTMARLVNEARAEAWASRDRSVAVELQPVRRIHLYSEFDDSFSSSAVYKTVFFLSVIGFLVLVIAWVNYVNLTTARALERAREVGIRKASGAKRSQVIAQFLVESLVVNAAALAIAVLLSRSALPLMNDIVGLSIPATIWASGWVWLGLGGLFGVGALLASLYPSLFLSRYRPAQVLKGIGRTRLGGKHLRQGLVVFQFALSICLISGMYIIFRQVDHLKGVDLGFTLDQTLVLRSPAIVDDPENYSAQRNAFLDEAMAVPGVELVATSNTVPGGGFNLGSTFRREAAPQDESVTVQATWVNYDFLDVYGFHLIAGRGFSRDVTSDGESAMLINETGALQIGYDDPEDAVGEQIMLGGDNPFEIVGVLADFDWMTAKQPHTPILLGLTTGGSYFSARLATADIPATLERLEALFKEHFPGNGFEFFFADDNFNDLYEAEVKLQTLVGLFAGFALLVAALGLIGLAALTTGQRSKEISIRKVLGASDLGVAGLLTGHFAVLVALGVAVSVPFVYFLADNWLNGFAERISLTPDTIALPGMVVLVVALGASAYHVFRASRSNPVDGIRGE